MAEPTPIREGVVPTLDLNRELVDFCTQKISQYAAEYGNPPTSIALVLSGDLAGTRATDAYSWDALEQRTQLETCSTAASVLLKRALGI